MSSTGSNNIISFNIAENAFSGVDQIGAVINNLAIANVERLQEEASTPQRNVYDTRGRRVSYFFGSLLFRFFRTPYFGKGFALRNDFAKRCFTGCNLINTFGQYKNQTAKKYNCKNYRTHQYSINNIHIKLFSSTKLQKRNDNGKYKFK